MKNQYVGDINDYRKYGLLRVLGRNLKIGVCWMLTDLDNRADGSKTSYLVAREKWRRFDPALFDLLHQMVMVEKVRNVNLIEQRELIPNAVFHPKLLVSERDARDRYFSNVLALFVSVDLVFFDPDNGVRDRSGWSRRHVYPYELAQAFARNHSVLVYQHFPRQPRAKFMKEAAERLRGLTSAPEVVLFKTPYVLFLLASQERDVVRISKAVREVRQSWHGQIEASVWPYNGCGPEVAEP